MTFTWHTSVSLPDYPLRLCYGQPVAAIGSCFAEHIGRRLEEYKFAPTVNPFGILYNPISIARALQRMREGYMYSAQDLFQAQGLWFSYDHHGRYAAPSAGQTLHHIQTDLEQGRQTLLQGRWLLLTLGTAHVWALRETNRVVANCHKQPASLFARKRLTVSDIVETLGRELQTWHERNPALQVILTVSPVRYLRDGLTESQRSKATLILAVDQLCRELPFVHYFPAYEIVLDELRDYRFYERDLIHPADMAVDYIWEKWIETLLDPTEHALLRQVQDIVTASRHRPLHPQTEAHQQFLRKQLEKITALERKWPFIDFSAEKGSLSKQL